MPASSGPVRCAVRRALRAADASGAPRFPLPWGAAAGACFALAVFLPFGTRIGPVVLVLSEQRGHGVHVGDLLAFPLLGAGAWALHRALVGRRR